LQPELKNMNEAKKQVMINEIKFEVFIINRSSMSEAKIKRGCTMVTASFHKS
jgi:hypothetical protein